MSWRSGLGLGALALVLAACGGTSQGKTEFTVDPLTQTVPASTIPADTPVEPGVFRLTGRPTLTYDLVRAAAGLGFFGREGLAVRITESASDAAAGHEWVNVKCVNLAVEAQRGVTRAAQAGHSQHVLLVVLDDEYGLASGNRDGIAPTRGLAFECHAQQKLRWQERGVGVVPGLNIDTGDSRSVSWPCPTESESRCRHESKLGGLTA